MNIPSQYSIPTVYARPRSKFNMTTLDRDAQAQRALLGDIAYIAPSSSPLTTPSPSLDGLSPLSVASHLQDAYSDGPFRVGDINPFLDAAWRNETESDFGEFVVWTVPTVRVCQPPPHSPGLLFQIIDQCDWSQPLLLPSEQSDPSRYQ
jgi:hypothetical protein